MENVHILLYSVVVLFAAKAMKIHCSQTTKECLDDTQSYKFEKRGTVEIKVCLHLV